MSPRHLAIALLACALPLPACGGDGSAGASDRPSVVATTGFVADLVRGIAGDRAEVVQLVPDGTDPHAYGASAKDRARLDAAALVVAVGAHYEEGLPLDTVAAPRLDVADHVGRLRPAATGGGHAGDEPAEDAAPDPHVWLDPLRMAAAAGPIGSALAEADPAHAAGYRDRAGAQARRLRALDAQLRDVLAAVPEGRRRLVTSHESLGYFAERYGFELVAAPFGVAPEAEAAGADLAEVVRAIRDGDVPVIFSQQGDDPRVMERIADEAGVRVVDDLLVENGGPQAATYADAMRHNARRIAEALAP